MCGKQLLRYLKSIVKFFLLHFKFWGKVSFGFFTTIGIDSTFEGANKVSPHSSFCGSMGYGSYIGEHSYIMAKIGRFTSIASYVHTNTGIHPMSLPFVTTCPMFFSTNKQNGHTFADTMMFNETKPITTIGNDCWIGENVFLAGGLTIGDGAVVLAGAVVTKDIPPYAVVGGIPAKVLRYRYDEETIRFLRDLKWWNKDLGWLQNNWDLLCDMEKLKRNERIVNR